MDSNIKMGVLDTNGCPHVVTCLEVIIWYIKSKTVHQIKHLSYTGLRKVALTPLLYARDHTEYGSKFRIINFGA
jgi:hypothetical protein